MKDIILEVLNINHLSRMKRIVTLLKAGFDYCFYKASSFYKKTGGVLDTYASGLAIPVLIVFSLIVAVFKILTYLLGRDFIITETITWIIAIVFCVTYGKGFNEEKYRILEERYKNESNPRAKGFLVLFCLILSIICMGCCIILL